MERIDNIIKNYYEEKEVQKAITLSLQPPLSKEEQEEEQQIQEAIKLSLQSSKISKISNTIDKKETDNSIRTNALERKQFRVLHKNGGKNDFSIISKHEDTLIDTAINKIAEHGIMMNDSNKNAIKKIALQAAEVRNLYKDTHYVFHHGQSTNNWIATSFLIKDLVNAFHPEKDTRGFKFLRTPAYLDAPGTKTTVIPTPEIDDNDVATGNLVLSSTAYLFDDEPGESALYYLASNKNVAERNNGIGIVKTVYEQIIKKFAPTCPPHIASKYADEILNEQKQLSIHADCGQLFTICIPKSVVEKKKDTIVYRSHSGGKKCTCHNPVKDKEALTKLQNNIIDADVRCDNKNFVYHTKSAYPISQYRIQIKNLAPEDGTMIFRHTPFDKKVLKVFKDKVHKIVEKLEIAQALNSWE